MRGSLFWIGAVLPVAAQIQAAQVQPFDRIVLATNVMCREQPSISSQGVGTLRLGDRLRTGDTQSEDGQSWILVVDKQNVAPIYSSMRGSCWVFGPLTTEFSEADPEPALIAVADHALGREEASFQELIAVENLFAWDPFAGIVESSGVLQARRLQLIDEAAWKSPDLREPLAQAWILAHRDILHGSPFSWSSWRVRPDVYWSAYESFESAPGAEDLAWAGAQATVFVDECYTDCALSVLTQTYMQYWVRFPAGREVVEAITRSIRHTEDAASFCILVSTGHLGIDRQRAGTLVNELRESLDAVTADERDLLIELLSEIEAGCVNGDVTDLTDERAIPGLLRALDNGFPMVTGSLADFGELAAGRVIEVTRSDGNDLFMIGEALEALRYMLEGTESRPLSAGTIEEIRSVAEVWLSKGQQSISTLSPAIDLAIVLGDPDLLSVVESLASDASEVVARGVERPSFVELIQRRATDRLSGMPPLPRRR